MKKQLIYTLSMLITAIIFQGCLGFNCELRDDFEEFDDIESISEATIQGITVNVNTLEVDTLLDGKIVIIDDAATYDSLKVNNENCEFCIFPEIDFTEKTLIGVFNQIDCEANSFTKITKTDTGYVHQTKAVNTSECSFLGCYNFSLGWHTIPKIDTSTTIETKFGESYKSCDCG